jgi:hypothetical protein
VQYQSLPRLFFHPGVSDDDGLWEYADGSVRDIASLVFASGVIVFVSADGRGALAWRSKTVAAQGS